MTYPYKASVIGGFEKVNFAKKKSIPQIDDVLCFI